jgi:hypothetical protein
MQDYRKRILVLKHLCSARLSNAERYIERLNRSFEAENKFLNIQESTSVKRLTMLASIFLPLSLSASLLSMQTRFKDLDSLIWDFFGVFCIIASTTIVIYFISRGFSPSGPFFCAIEMHLMDTSSSSSDQYKKYDLGRWVGYWVPKLLFISIWLIVTVSFIVGMFLNIPLGLKVLGFSFAGLFGLVIFIFICVAIGVYFCMRLEL